MENTWLKYLAQRLFEDAGGDQLDKNDPAVKAILNNPSILASFTKNPANVTKNQKDARMIVNKALTTNKSLPLVAQASNVSQKAGMN